MNAPLASETDALPSQTAAPRIFVSAAEPSGDRHAASLIRAILNVCPAARFFGVAGPQMQAAGCEAIDDWTDRSAMLVGAIGLVGRAWKLLRGVRRRLDGGGADLAILVDSPALHLPMAKRAKRAGRPVLYYIAPQLWAWAPWRIRKLRARVDRLAAILPFEEGYFRQRGVPATYVGHPLVEQLTSAQTDSRRAEEIRRSGRPVVACLPGSRTHVIREVLPGQIEVARRIAEAHPDVAFPFLAADDRGADQIRAALNSAQLNARVELGASAEVLSAADLALCASGTATLEVAYHRVPLVIMYNGPKWGYRLVGRWLVRTEHLSLVNILAGRRIVPEFMPYYTSTAPIADAALELLADEARREQMRRDLDGVIISLGTSSASENTARMALQMISERMVKR